MIKKFICIISLLLLSITLTCDDSIDSTIQEENKPINSDRGTANIKYKELNLFLQKELKYYYISILNNLYNKYTVGNSGKILINSKDLKLLKSFEYLSYEELPNDLKYEIKNHIKNIIKYLKKSKRKK